MVFSCIVFETLVIMLKPCFKFCNYILKSLKVIHTFIYHYFPVPGECVNSLVQAVMSQVENCRALKRGADWIIGGIIV